MLSVIIPAYNAGATIATQLEALAKQEYSAPWEVIVSDNGSTDNTREIVKQYQQVLPNLRLLDASACRGSGYARNLAGQQAQGDYLIFCDADDEVAPGWLTAMATALAEHDFVCGVGDHSKLNIGNSFCAPLSQIEGSGVVHHPYLPFAGASNLGVKRSLHEAVGGFDKKFLALQDKDYCWRIQEMGNELHQTSEAVVYFRFREGFQSSYQRQCKFGYFTAVLHHKHFAVNAFPKWFVLRCSWSLLLVPIKFLVRVRDQDSFFLWVLNLGWSLGYWRGWLAVLRETLAKSLAEKRINPLHS